MKNDVLPHTRLGSHKAPYLIDAGDCVLVDGIFGVASHAAYKDEIVNIHTEGEFLVGKLAAEFWRKGDKLYWDGIRRRLTVAEIGPLVAIAVDDTSKAMQNIGAIRLLGNNPRESKV